MNKYVVLVLGCVLVPMGLAAYLRPLSPAPSAVSGQAAGAGKSAHPPDLSNKTPDDLAAYIFSHHGCGNCHTLGKAGKFGFTDRGKELGKNFEGCVSLLSAMNVIAQSKPESRSEDDKHRAARFAEYGCTTCHQIEPGKLGLTEYGRELKSLHMACTDMQKILAK